MSRRDPKQDILAFDTGHYRLCLNANLVATQAATPAGIFSCRWTDATRLMVVERVRLSWMQNTAFTATQFTEVVLFVARAYSVTDTNGASVLANVVKQRTNMAATLLADARVTNAAGGITAGTRTLDTGKWANLLTTATITNVNGVLYTATLEFDPNKHPLVLAANEGLVLVLAQALPAAGSATATIELDWAEVDGF